MANPTRYDWFWYDQQKVQSHPGWTLNDERSTPDRACWTKGTAAIHHHRDDGGFLAQSGDKWINELFDSFAEAEAAL